MHYQTKYNDLDIAVATINILTTWNVVINKQLLLANQGC